MKRRRIIVRVLLTALLGYFLSYIAMSLRGHYEPSSYGPIQGPDDTVIMAPRSYGYIWNPFRTNRLDPDGDHEWEMKLMTFYAPLIFIDSKIWHSRKKENQVGNGEYRVKYFFDRETKTYRDIEPN